MTIWLMASNLSNQAFQNDAAFFAVSPNPTIEKQVDLSFSLLQNENARVDLYDGLGRLVKEVEYTDLVSGINHKIIDASSMASGVYFCKLSSSTQSKSLRVIIR